LPNSELETKWKGLKMRERERESVFGFDCGYYQIGRQKKLEGEGAESSRLLSGAFVCVYTAVLCAESSVGGKRY
jgi:hypothetical protein